MTAPSPAPFDTLECPHAARCSGCAHWGTPYPAQLELKRAALLSAFAGYGLLEGRLVAPTEGASPSQGYRVRSKLAVDRSGALGLYARGSHEVVDIPECRIQSPALGRVTAALRELVRGTALLHAVDLRLVDRGVLVSLVVPERTPLAPVAQLARRLAEHAPDVIGVAVSFHAEKSALLLGVDQRVLWGNEREHHHLAPDAPYELVTHGSFTQAHLGQAVKLHERIEQALAAHGARRVLELYAGSCSLALRLSARGLDVTAVEAFAPALRQGVRAAEEQQLSLKTVPGAAERVARELAARGEQFDAVILNPPRAGAGSVVRSALAALRPELVIYVSCQPDTLARDLSHLALFGFRLEALTPFDMIPLSDAVESLALLIAGEPALPRVIHETDKLIAVDKSGYEPTTPQGEHAHSLLARVRRLPGARDAVPVHRLDLGTSGVCLFARRAGDVAELAAALTAGHKTYLALARGITHEKGRIARPLRDGPRNLDAVTRYLRRAVHGSHSLLTVMPEHGRTHQIRRHLAGIGHPVLGDARHGDARSNRHFEHRLGLDRPFLHCAQIRLELAGAELDLQAPLAPELARVLGSLDQAAAQRE